MEQIPVPLLIYQSGKVGSTTVWATLERCAPSLPLAHPVHVLNPHRLAQLERWVGTDDPGVERSRQLRRLIDDTWGHARWTIITLVRDPLARMVASAFATCHERNHAGETTAHFDEAAFLDGVLDELLLNGWSFDHTVNWFELEMATVFECDLLQQPFDPAIGWASYEFDHARVLVMRTDQLNRTFADAFGRFLGVKVPALTQENRADDKAYAGLYRAFLKSVSLPAEFVGSALDSPMARHFFSESERGRMRQRWTQGES